ncbi:HU family DNA-binding protein [Pedobacter agri]|uniref:HU family DNA-binding protein n=1 Tax=Pedobacter agri TaxID=454586 RepID=UPI00292FA334|nr:HU family DNA-binding protein [Pedobacter agri]
MTKADMIKIVAKQIGMDKEVVSTILESLLKSVRQNLSDGRQIYIRGFASFILKKRAAKTGRNISNNTSLEISEHFIPYFKPSKAFKELVKAKMV